ncbi:MAG: hypothetical protein IKX54_03435 [Lachnospiraceae bacterium]|nr:hypothetical protein [Lachnospiraceae bacterium]
MKAAAIVIGIILALLVIGIIDRKRKERELLAKLRRNFAGPAKNNMNSKRRATLGAYRDSLPARTYDIDSITWNDLEMEGVFDELNRTQSSVGEEYLYASLFRPESGEDELNRREALISLFSEREDVRLSAQKELACMGKLNNVSLYKYLTSFDGVKSDGYLRHLLPTIGFAAGIVLGILGYGFWCTLLLIFTAGYAIVTYYRRKSDVDPYLKAMTFVNSWIGSIHHMAKNVPAKGTVLEPELEEMCREAHEFDSFRRGAWLLAPTDTDGDPLQMLFDYVRMLFHLDMIQFNRMYRILQVKEETLSRLFGETGRIDMAIAVASYRAYRSDWCLPELTKESTPLSFTDLCHPMIAKPVPNSLSTGRSVLLTGSNASGKSTFLKTVAINAILAQTIHTVLGTSYKSVYYRIFSSMALRDDLAAKQSYYIVEIRSLKRILDAIGDGEPVICFVDEVLRGTNTAERIAASGQILRYLADKGVLCFAATHDLELTDILAESCLMYHFSETVTEDNVTFDYQLKDGKATSRNAIALLRMFGYPTEIVEQADRDAKEYLAKS